jgi:hypothetical protein
MQSDARNVHMNSFLFGMPVDVVASWWWSIAPEAEWLLMVERGSGWRCSAGLAQ